MTVWKAARELASRGLPVLPLHDNGKKPRILDWHNAASVDHEQIARWERKWPDANLGMATGLRSRIVVIDVDLPDGDQSIAELEKRLGPLPDGPKVLTPSGGVHRYFHAPATPLATTQRLCGMPDVDVRAEDNGQVVVPPSKINGVEYIHVDFDMDLPELPEAWVEAMAKPPELAEQSPPTTPATGASDKRAQRYCAQALIDEAAAVRNTPKGSRNETLHDAALKLAGLVHLGVFTAETVRHHLESACAAWHVRDPSKDTDTIERGIKFGLEHPRTMPTPTPRAAPDRVAPPPDPAADGVNVDAGEISAANALLRLQMGKKGPKENAFNTMEVLTKHPSFQGLFEYNEHSGRIRYVKHIPGDTLPTGGDLEDHHTTALRVAIAKWLDFEPSDSTAHQCIVRDAQDHSVHPLRDWLHSLQWDGIPRIDTMLQRYFGAAPGDTNANERLALGARVLMLSAVRRVMQPGIKADVCLVLHGDQGKMKSSCLAALFGDEYFADTKLDIGNKDALVALQGKWCYELAELSALRRSDIETVKGFISSRVDDYRPPYGRASVKRPRQVVFVGSTNNPTPFADRTGNRRFFSVLVVDYCDPAALARDREQLWAEAVARAQTAERHWLTVDEENAAALVQEQFVAPTGDDEWTQLIATWLALPTRRESFVTSVQIFADALGVEKSKMSVPDSKRVAQIMRAMHGWEPSRRGPDRGYRRL